MVGVEVRPGAAGALAVVALITLDLRQLTNGYILIVCVAARLAKRRRGASCILLNELRIRS